MSGAVDNLLHTENRQAWNGMEKVKWSSFKVPCLYVKVISNYEIRL